MEQAFDIHHKNKKILNVRPHEGYFIVENCTTNKCGNANEAMATFKRGNDKRTIKLRLMNKTSTRGHGMMTITLANGGKLSLVDLAGTEKVKRTGAEGLTMQEANKINTNLTIFGRVVKALSEKTLPPWRESLHTKLLKSMIRGHTSLVLCGYTGMAEETTSTLNLGLRAKKIVIPSSPPKKTKKDYKNLYEKEQEKSLALDEQVKECKHVNRMVAKRADVFMPLIVFMIFGGFLVKKPSICTSDGISLTLT